MSEANRHEDAVAGLRHMAFIKRGEAEELQKSLNKQQRVMDENRALRDGTLQLAERYEQAACDLEGDVS